MPTPTPPNYKQPLHRRWLMATGYLMLLLGVVVAYRTLKILSAPDGSEKPRIDTSYVRVVNLGNGLDTLLATLVRAQMKDTNKTGRAVHQNRVRPAADTPELLGVATVIPSYYRPQPRLRQRQVDSLYARERTQHWAARFGVAWILLFCIVGLFLFSCGIVLYAMEPLATKEDIDRDPDALTAAFEACHDDILKKANPRRIKRFSNKVRFHFYYLTAMWGDRFKTEDAEDMARILLQIEDHYELMDMDELQRDGREKDVAWFYTTIVVRAKLPRERSSTDPLVEQLFDLNKNTVA